MPDPPPPLNDNFLFTEPLNLKKERKRTERKRKQHDYEYNKHSLNKINHSNTLL